MDIYFGLNYSPDAYVDLTALDGIAFDTVVVNAEGLIGLIELHLGLHYENVQQIHRQVKWLTCMRQAIAHLGKNPFAESWAKNALGVSNECLAWRDTLRLALWRNDMAQPGDKLALIAEADKCYDRQALGDRIIGACAAIAGNPFKEDTTIHVSELGPQALPAAVSTLLAKLQDVGVNVCYDSNRVLAMGGTNLAKVQSLLAFDKVDDTLARDDDSFKIWQFDSAADAYRYISMLPNDQFDVYVASPNGRKLLDNTQKMLGQPTSGTKVSNSSPQIVQMFLLGMNLFEYPLNINSLLAWLQLPLHPIPAPLRHRLVKAIVETGGFDNERYNDAIGEYLENLPTDKERDDAVIALETYDIRPEERVDVALLSHFNKSLNTWATQMSMIEGIDEARRSQLVIVSTLCTALDTILDDIPDIDIPYRRLEAAISTLYTGTEFNMYQPQQGSRHAVAYGEIATDADSVIWTDCYNYESTHSPYDFLNSYEREVLTREGCKFQGAEQYNRAAIRTLRQPVLRSRRQCVLVTVDKALGTETTKHPLVIRLVETFRDSLCNVIARPSLDAYQTQPIAQVDNSTHDTIVKVDCQLPMPVSESYTSLNVLIQYPLDYVLERIAKINTYASTGLKDVRTVKGDVAHKMIERLFVGDNNSIAEGLKYRFEDTLKEVINEEGAVLLLPENDLERTRYVGELRDCLDALLDILVVNDLEVAANEYEINTHIGFWGDASDPTMRGFVDMVLRDRDGNYVIFDFKWTASRTYYRRLLEEDLSLQLALYRHMLQLDGKTPVVATGYFTMPWHRLFTTSETLHGANVKNVEPKYTADLVELAINSYRFRCAQLLDGEIENGEGRPIKELTYTELEEECGEDFFPLTIEYGTEDIHARNQYSIYTCFKSPLHKKC